MDSKAMICLIVGIAACSCIAALACMYTTPRTLSGRSRYTLDELLDEDFSDDRPLR